MSILASFLVPHWLRGINNINTAELSIKKIISDSDYFVSNVVAGRAEITFTNNMSVLKAFASEMGAMSKGAVETISAVTCHPSLAKSLAWVMIQGYYAAFYSAHALLRLSGVSLSYLEQLDLRRINLLSTQSGFQTISSGNYLVSAGSTQRDLILESAAIGGGAHVDIWREFARWVDALATSGGGQQLRSVDREKVRSKLRMLHNIITKKGSLVNGNWLSMKRNEYNYRLSPDVWHPYNRKDKGVDSVLLRCSKWKGDPMEIDLDYDSASEMELVASAASFMVAMVVVSCQELAKRCAVGKSFTQNGALHLHRLID